MKLVIRRSQSEDRSFFGTDRGMTFKLEAWAVISDAERELMDRYKGASATLLTVIKDLNPKTPVVTVTPGSLVAGAVFQCKDVLTLVQAEQEIKEGCDNFRILLEVMASFGGVEEFDFGTAEASAAAVG